MGKKFTNVSSLAVCHAPVNGYQLCCFVFVKNALRRLKEEQTEKRYTVISLYNVEDRMNVQ